MKVLVVSVASLNEPHRAAYDHLAGEPGWQVDIVAPESIAIASANRSKACDPPLPGARYRLHPLPMLFPNSGRFMWFKGLAALAKRLAPDVVFIEQDPGSLAVLEAWAIAPRAKRIAFTVENIEHHRFADARRALSAGKTRDAARDAVIGTVCAVGAFATTGLACISEEGRRIFRDRAGWKKPIGVVPLGTDTTRFTPGDASAKRSELGLGDSFVAGYFGRLVPEKGVHLLVEALSQLPPSTKLLLDMFKNFEPGSYAASVMDKARSLGVLDRITTIDVPHQQIPEYMRCCDVVVLPSLTTDRWKEQFGRVLPEAMACGVPVIGSRSGNIPDLLGDAGILVQEGSAAAIADAVSELQRDPERRRRLSVAGRERVIAQLSVEAQVTRMKELFAGER